MKRIISGILCTVILSAFLLNGLSDLCINQVNSVISCEKPMDDLPSGRTRC